MRTLTLAIGFTTLLCLPVLAADNITPPLQPESGPGGKQYKCASVVEHSYGKGGRQYWLFEPDSPKPASAPVVIFNHGWTAMKPEVYQAWIDHIVKRGNIVIYPRYQGSLFTMSTVFATNATASIKDALKRLESEPGHVQPMLDKVAIVGHSAGAVISADITIKAASAGLPSIKALMCVQPGRTWGSKLGRVPLGDLSLIPTSTLLLAVAGDCDTVIGDTDTKRIFNETINVLPENKNYIIMQSDEHGSPPLLASHFCPAAPERKIDNVAKANCSKNGLDSGDSADTEASTSNNGLLGGKIKERLRERRQKKIEARRTIENGKNKHLNMFVEANIVDALDYYGTWKLFDGLCDAAFYGKDRQYALGNTPQQRYMGTWSDGVPVKELVVELAKNK